MSDIFINNDFDQLNSNEIAAVLSCFTNISIKQEDNINFISDIECNNKIKNVLKKIKINMINTTILK